MSGLRKSELAALEPSSFDLATRTVTVAAAYTKAKVTRLAPDQSDDPGPSEVAGRWRGLFFPGW